MKNWNLFWKHSNHRARKQNLTLVRKKTMKRQANLDHETYY